MEDPCPRHELSLKLLEFLFVGAATSIRILQKILGKLPSLATCLGSSLWLNNFVHWMVVAIELLLILNHVYLIVSLIIIIIPIYK